MKRVNVMSHDDFLQITHDLDNCVSMPLDESLDEVNTVEMAVFARMGSSAFMIKEELLRIIQLRGCNWRRPLFCKNDTFLKFFSYLYLMLISTNKRSV